MSHVKNFLKNKDSVKTVFGVAGLALAVSGFYGIGPGAERFSKDRYQVGMEMPFTHPENGPPTILRERLKETIRSSIQNVEPSAAQYGISKGLNSSELARLALRNPEGQRGIFDITGVTEQMGEDAKNNFSSLPHLMKPGVMGSGYADGIVSELSNTVSGDSRKGITERTFYHESQAEKLFKQGDIPGAVNEARIVLQGVSVLSSGGLELYKNSDSRTNVADLTPTRSSSQESR
jgi:hypothetical protein